MVDLPGPAQRFSRWELIRDALVFQAKLFLDGLRDLLLVPVSLVALVVDLVTGGEHAGRNFYGVVLLGRRSESWIDLFAAGDRIEARQDRPEADTPRIDDVFERLEQVLQTEQERGGVTASAKRSIDRLLDSIQLKRRD
jgi:hypothetical protein